jgi:predicted permease
VRTALGASRSRIFGQLLTESLLLSILGGAFGLLIGVWAIDLVVASLDYIPIERHEVAVRPAVVLYTIALSALAALASGLAPALAASRASVNDALKEGQSSASAGRSRNRMRHALVVGQLAVALPLLIASGLTLRHVRGIKVIDYGFNPERLITMRVDLPEHRYSTETEWATFYAHAVRSIEDLPGIEAAGAALDMPVIMFNTLMGRVHVEGREPADPARPDYVAYQPMTPGFFPALEVPLLRGRFFNERDVARAQPVAMINSRMAGRYWPDENPLGKRVALGRDVSEATWFTIVGEVADTGRKFSGDPQDPTLYLPQEQLARPDMFLVARTSGDPRLAIPALRDAIRQMDAEVPVHDFRTVPDLIHEICRDDRLAVGFLATLAVLSLTLASIGLYGVMSFLVEQRTLEIGVRVALGAGYRNIMHLILRRCLRLATVGIAVGMALAVPVGLGMQSYLWGITGVDPLA